MSKLPVREARQEVLSPKMLALIALLQGIIPALSAIFGGLFVFWTYFHGQKEAEAARLAQQKQTETTRFFEAQKPFYDKQLTTYFEAAHIGGLLATLRPGTPEWSAAKARFYAMYWSELSLVEDGDVQNSMVNLERTIRNTEGNDGWHQDLRGRVYCLAQALKRSISATWTVNFSRENIPTWVNQETPSRKQCGEEVKVFQLK